jgi:hypothetical protein
VTDLVTRDAQPADVAFVMANWLRTWRTSPYAGCIANDEYHDVTRRAIEQLIARGAKIRVAEIPEQDVSTPDDRAAGALRVRPARLAGFLCHEVTADGRSVAHAGFAKDAYVALGPLERLVTEMPGAGPVLVTFRTPQLTRALEASGLRWTHAPEVARRR